MRFSTTIIVALLVMGIAVTSEAQQLGKAPDGMTEELIDKYGDDPEMLNKVLDEIATEQRSFDFLSKGAAAQATDFVGRDEAEPNNFFDTADNINDVLAMDGWRTAPDGSAEFNGMLVRGTFTEGDIDVFRFTVDTTKMYYFASNHAFNESGGEMPVNMRLFHESDLDTTVVPNFNGIDGNEQITGDILGRNSDGRNGAGFRLTGWTSPVDPATGQALEGDFYLWMFQENNQVGEYHFTTYSIDRSVFQAKFEKNQNNIEVLNNGLISTLPADAVTRSFMLWNPDTTKIIRNFDSPTLDLPSQGNTAFPQLLARGDEDVDHFFINYRANHTLVVETQPYFGWYRTQEGDIGPGSSRHSDPRILLWDADYVNVLFDDDDGARESMDGPNNIHSRFFLTPEQLAEQGVTGDTPLWLWVGAWASQTRTRTTDDEGRGVDNRDPGRMMYDVYYHLVNNDLDERNSEPNNDPSTAMGITGRADTLISANGGDDDFYRLFMQQVRMYSLVVTEGATVTLHHEYESDNATGATTVTDDLLASGERLRYAPQMTTSNGYTVYSGIVPEESGAYLVKVNNGADYELGVIDKGEIWHGLIANEPDDVAEDALTQDPLETGPGAAAANGMVFPANDLDHYYFDAEEGEDITLSISATTSAFVSDFDLVMTLFDADFNELGQSSQSISLSAPAAGTYIVQVAAANAGEVGFYTLSGGEALTEKEPNDTWDMATPFVVNNIFEATLTAGDIDWWTIELQEGSSYSFRSLDNTTGGELTVEFFDDPEGETLLDDSGWPDNYSGSNFKIANIIPTETKPYYLKISGSAGGYKVLARRNTDFAGLSVRNEPDNTPADADANGPFQSFGSDVPGYLFADNPPRWFGDEDWFAVDMAPGQTLTVETKPWAGGGQADDPDLWNRDTDTKLVIFAADGTTELADDDDGGNDWYSLVSYSLPAEAAAKDAAAVTRVYVQVRTSRDPEGADDRSMNRGDYYLNMTLTVDEVEPNNTFAEADNNPLESGFINATFTDDDLIDIFRLDLAGDRIYHFRTTTPDGVDGTFTARLVSSADTGTNLLSDTEAGYNTRYSDDNVKINAIVDEAGAYYLVLESSAAGEYQVGIKSNSVTDLSGKGEPNNSIAEADAQGAQPFDLPGQPREMMLYQEGCDNGFFANRFCDDRDFYRYDLMAGQTIVAETAPYNGSLWPRDTDMYMELHAPDGTIIDDNDDGGEDWHSKITYTADADETVYVVIRSQDFEGGTDRDPTRAEYHFTVTTDMPRDPVSSESDELPEEFTVSQNYPNPFNPSTTFTYSLPEAADVEVAIYDMLGQRVTTLTRATQSAGTYSVRFDASHLASGMYFYQVKAGQHVQTMRMLLVK